MVKILQSPAQLASKNLMSLIALINFKNLIAVSSWPKGSICSMQILESFWDLAVFQEVLL